MKAEFKVGITVVIAVVVLVLGILWGKGRKISGSYMDLVMEVPSASGVNAGDAVTVNGVRKGRVDGIQLDRGRVFLHLKIEENVQLYTDIKGYVEPLDLMGGKKIEIKPGRSGVELRSEDLTKPIQGDYVPGVPEMLGLAGRLAERVNEVVAQTEQAVAAVNRIVTEEKSAEKLKQSIADLHVVTAEMRNLVTTNRAKIEGSIEDFQGAARALSELAGTRASAIDSTLIRFARTAARLDSFSLALNDMMARISSEESSIGQFLSDETTYAQLTRAVGNIDSLSIDLKKNLARYLEKSDISLINLFAF